MGASSSSGVVSCVVVSSVVRRVEELVRVIRESPYGRCVRSRQSHDGASGSGRSAVPPPPPRGVRGCGCGFAVSSSSGIATATAASAIVAALDEGPAYRPPRREVGDYSPLLLVVAVVVVVVVDIDRGGLGTIMSAAGAHVEARYYLAGGVRAALTRAIRPPLLGGGTHAPPYPEAEFAEERTLLM